MRVNDGFVLRNIYGKEILMPTRKNEVGDTPIVLNEVAAQIWKRAPQKETTESLLEEISALYGLEKNSIEENSVRVFITQLLENKLIFD